MPDALRDTDSGLLNDDYFRAALPNRVATARRVLRPISVGVLALSDDAATATVAYALQDTLRESDTACRLGDGRFAVLLEDTPEDGAVWTLERLRRQLGEQGVDVTIWGGVASYPAHALEAADLLALAESALESARQWADGRIEVAGPA
ncbi:MAG: diguanylate cyclase [Acidimicrobiales bacterium]|nr:diguanylate cyclase [Acidimicrobiales bacterium]